MSTAMMVKELKAAGQDHEWYPTTKEIIKDIHRDIGNSRNNGLKILDIGAGDGNFFKVMEELEEYKESCYQNKHTKYAIERSEILIKAMPADVFIVGTDFHEQTLIDKKMDMIFCNPPYSEYAEWTEKIIKESNAETVYMVIPRRWENHEGIKYALKSREATTKIIGGDYVFMDSEYRKAMTTVNIVKIEFANSSYGHHRLKIDPFAIWFGEHFKISADKIDESWENKRPGKEKLHELVQGTNLISRLEELYLDEFQHLLSNYKAVENLDASILKELGVSVSGLMEGLKGKIEGLKNLYWKELFDNLDKLTDRLTVKSRKSLLATLFEHTAVDFTASNAYSIVIWAIKNSNKYYNEQMIAVYKNLSNSENVQLFKSNNHIVEDGWRYGRSSMSHYTLDYRIVHNHWNAIYREGSFGEYEYTNKLHNSAHETLSDIFTIAANLGFNVGATASYRKQWGAGKKNTFVYLDKDLKEQVFGEIKAHLNGNIHFKLNKEFLKAWNIEVSRLLGWIKSPKEAAEEMQDITFEDATRYFKSNLQLLSSDVKLLT